MIKKNEERKRILKCRFCNKSEKWEMNTTGLNKKDFTKIQVKYGHYDDDFKLKNFRKKRFYLCKKCLVDFNKVISGGEL
jgi:hypothetical protein